MNDDKDVFSDPLVSVIVPVYNAATYLQSTLESALSQTYRNIEIIVVDDGSTDNSAALVRDFMARDQRIRLLCQQQHGVASARNAGIATSRGEYIAPLDADDLWSPVKIERQVAAIGVSSSIGCVITACCGIDTDDRVLWFPRSWRSFSGYALPTLILENISGCASSPLLRRSSVEAIGGYDTSLAERGAQGCEDYKLLLLLAERYEVVISNMPLTGYRQVADSMSASSWRMLKSHSLTLADLRERHPELPSDLFRWGRYGVCIWLAKKSATQRATLDMIRFIGLALASDWRMALYALVRIAMQLNSRAAFGRVVGLSSVAVHFPVELATEPRPATPSHLARVLTRHRHRVIGNYSRWPPRAAPNEGALRSEVEVANRELTQPR